MLGSLVGDPAGAAVLAEVTPFGVIVNEPSLGSVTNICAKPLTEIKMNKIGKSNLVFIV